MQRSKDVLEKRAQIIRTIREFFWSQGFIETDTPTLVVSPGMEPHIRPIATENPKVFLPTSPEFAMKKLLAEGFENIFPISKAYRNEPKSATHNPEFAMLEWYRTDAGYEAIMDDVEALFKTIATRHAPERYDHGSPWPRMSVREVFAQFVGLDLGQALEDIEMLARKCVELNLAPKDVLQKSSLNAPGAWDDFFFRIMLNVVETRLEQMNRPIIMHSYPPSQCALANMECDSEGRPWAKRFEVYAGGHELGNAFDELIDSNEQRRRFEKDMNLRKQIDGNSFKENPIDEEFLSALKKMPKSGGIAMGVDRIVMYFLEKQSIEEVLFGNSNWS